MSPKQGHLKAMRCIQAIPKFSQQEVKSTKKHDIIINENTKVNIYSINSIK